MPSAKNDVPEPAVAARLPDLLTPAAVAFFEEEARLLGFVAFVQGLATQADRVSAIARAALERDPQTQADLEAQIGREGQASRKLRKYRELLRQTVLVRSVDSYLTYISEMLGTIFRLRPNMMRSDGQVRLDFVLKHASLDDLINAVAEREVGRLAYKGLTELSDELAKRFRVVLFEDDEQKQDAVLSVERRNLIVHNRGIINGRWTQKLGDRYGSVGEALDLQAHGPFDALTGFHNAVVTTDARLVGKFALPTERTPEHLGVVSGHAGAGESTDAA